MKKKNILQVGGRYKEFKFKEFCVFDHIVLLFFNGLFQSNYFKKHFTEKKVKVHVLEKPVFVASLTVPL